MKAQNMTSARGNKVTNQFIITDNEHNTVTFQSYESEIVTVDYNNLVLYVGRNWDYSVTTGKYRNLFMSEYVGYLDNKKDFERALNNGTFVDRLYRTWTVLEIREH